MKKLLILSFFILTFSLYQKSFSDTIKLDLKEAINRAYDHDYELKNSELSLTNSKIRTKEVFKQILPSIDYSSKYSEYDDTKSINSKKVNRYTDHEVSITQPIYTGGVVSANISNSKLNFQKNEYLYDAAKINTMLETIDKYLSILSSMKELEVYQLTLLNLEKEYQRSKRKFELDMIPKTDILPLNTRILNIKTSIVETENMIKIETIDLKHYIGVNNEDEITLEPLSNTSYDISKIDLESDVKYAKEHNRTVKIGQLDLKTKINDTKIARADFLPKVNGVLSYTSGDERFHDSTNSFSWVAGINVKMNIFEFGRSTDNYQISKNEILKAENKLKKTKNDAELQLRTSYQNLVKYKGIIESQTIALQSAEENYNLGLKRFGMDLVDVITLLDLEKDYVQSQLNLIIAQYNYFKAYEFYKSLLK